MVLDQQQGLISLDNSGTPSTPSGPTFLLNQTIDSSVASPLSSSDWVSSTGGVLALFHSYNLEKDSPMQITLSLRGISGTRKPRGTESASESSVTEAEHPTPAKFP